MNSYNPQIRAQQMAAQREATDAAAHHLPGAAPAAGPAIEPKGVLKFQDAVIDHAAELRGAITETLFVYGANGKAGLALDYLQAVLDAGHLGVTEQPQSRMDADSGAACLPLTAQQADKMAAGADPFRIDARRQVLREATGIVGPTILAPAIDDQFGGGIYAGPTEIDGKPAHLILLADEIYGVDWDAAMKWAASIGGSLPTRSEQRLLFANQKVVFKENWYWSCEQRADRPTSAWGQYFGIGNQYSDLKSCCEFARAVRRLPV